MLNKQVIPKNPIDGQMEGGVGAEWRWARGRKMGTSVIVSTIKIKLKKVL